MNLELLLRRFWWVLLIVGVFLLKNLQRKAQIKDRRRRSAAKARKAKKEGLNPKASSGSGSKPRKKLTKAQFKARMADGKKKAAARRARGG